MNHTGRSLIFSIIFNQIELQHSTMMLLSNLAQAVMPLTSIRFRIAAETPIVWMVFVILLNPSKKFRDSTLPQPSTSLNYGPII
jgi:hypothetical protein